METTAGMVSVPRSSVRRIFLVGCPRSGTTIVQSLIARHAALFTLPETQFFVELLNGLEEWIRGDEERRGVKWRRRLWLTRSGMHDKLSSALAPVLDNPSIGAQLRWHLRGEGYIPDLIRILDAAANWHHDDGWLEKSPNHLAYVDLIERYVPDAYFLHVLRNGEDVVASAIDAQIHFSNQTGFDGGIDQWVRHWNRATEVHLRHAGRPRHLILLHEDIVSEPDASVERIIDFCGVRRRDEGERAAYSVADLGSEPWKAASVGGTVTAPARKFESLFGPTLRRWIREHLSDYDEIRRQLRARQQDVPMGASGAVRGRPAFRSGRVPALIGPIH